MACCTDSFMHTNFTRYQGTLICHVLESLALQYTGTVDDIRMYVSFQMAGRSAKKTDSTTTLSWGCVLSIEGTVHFDSCLRGGREGLGD